MFDLPYNLNIPLMLYHWSNILTRDHDIYIKSCASSSSYNESTPVYLGRCNVSFTKNDSVTSFDIKYGGWFGSYHFKIHDKDQSMFDDLYLVDKGELDISEFTSRYGTRLFSLKDSMDEYALKNKLGEVWKNTNQKMKNIVVQEFS
mgnify:CR=1 FL=1